MLTEIKIFDVSSFYKCEVCGAKWGEEHKPTYVKSDFMFWAKSINVRKTGKYHFWLNKETPLCHKAYPIANSHIRYYKPSNHCTTCVKNLKEQNIHDMHMDS